MIATGNHETSQNQNNQAGGYVDLGITSDRDISVQATGQGNYLDHSGFNRNQLDQRLNQVTEAYNETIRRTDAEFASPEFNRNEFACLDRMSGNQVTEEEVHSFRMTCECLEQNSMMDLVEHVLNVRKESKMDAADCAESRPVLIHVADYQEAIELDRRLKAFGVNTHLSSPFSNWTAILGKLGTGQIDVIISTTIEIPHVDQIAWKAIYLPSAMHLAMLTTPALDWLGNYWFANNLDEQPPRLIVRRQPA